MNKDLFHRKKLVKEGIRAVRAGDSRRGFDLYTEALRIAPSAIVYHLRYASRKTRSDALADLNEAIKYRPIARIFISRGRMYGLNGETKKAIADFTTAIRLTPKDPKVYHNRGLALLAEGKLGEALADFNKAIELKPDLAEIYIGRGALYGRRGQFILAKKDFDKAIELDPKNREAYLNRASVFGLTGQFNLAKKDLEKVIEIAPHSEEADSARATLKKIH